MGQSLGVYMRLHSFLPSFLPSFLGRDAAARAKKKPIGRVQDSYFISMAPAVRSQHIVPFSVAVMMIRIRIRIIIITWRQGLNDYMPESFNCCLWRRIDFLCDRLEEKAAFYSRHSFGLSCRRMTEMNCYGGEMDSITLRVLGCCGI